MKVLILGAGGQLGRDVTAVAQEVNHEVIALDYRDLDITDRSAVERTIDAQRPGAVVNCAAFTQVDDAEEHECEAMAINADGAQNVALATAALKSVVVYPSSDYVFDGAKNSPYVESDLTNPISAYGRSKLAGEQATIGANPRHFVVRSSWLFGIDGRNFVETMLSLAEELGEVLVVNDQLGCPTYTRHLAVGIVRLLDTTEYGIHHMAGGGSCSWYEFASEIFTRSNRDVQLMAGTSEMLTRLAPRPAYSVLGTEREDAIVLPNWQDGLQAYLHRRERQQTAA